MVISEDKVLGSCILTVHPFVPETSTAFIEVVLPIKLMSFWQLKIKSEPKLKLENVRETALELLSTSS